MCDTEYCQPRKLTWALLSSFYWSWIMEAWLTPDTWLAFSLQPLWRSSWYYMPRVSTISHIVRLSSVAQGSLGKQRHSYQTRHSKSSRSPPRRWAPRPDLFLGKVNSLLHSVEISRTKLEFKNFIGMMEFKLTEFWESVNGKGASRLYNMSPWIVRAL